MTRLLFIALVFSVSSCTKDIVLKSSIKFIEYSDEEFAVLSDVLDLPRDFDSYNVKGRNVVFNTKATLGRVLFYDKNLSADGTVSCASCHKQELAFSDSEPFSTGIFGRSTKRNSLALGTFESFENEYGSDGNSGLTSLFWDMRANNTHLQIESTLANENEMGMQLGEVVDRIQDKDHYKILFEKAFITDRVEDHMILAALESFMQSMSAGNSKFDQMQRGINSQIGSSQVFLTDLENQGHKLFAANCASCHGRSVNMKLGDEFRMQANNGLERESLDRGFGETTGMTENDGIFKIPSLRNIALTGPYMHDGRFSSLREVLDFYSDQIQAHKNLGSELRDENGLPRKFNFTEGEKDALIAFLETFTDMSELKHSKFSDPWKN